MPIARHPARVAASRSPRAYAATASRASPALRLPNQQLGHPDLSAGKIDQRRSILGKDRRPSSRDLHRLRKLPRRPVGSARYSARRLPAAAPRIGSRLLEGASKSPPRTPRQSSGHPPTSRHIAQFHAVVLGNIVGKLPRDVYLAPLCSPIQRLRRPSASEIQLTRPSAGAACSSEGNGALSTWASVNPPGNLCGALHSQNRNQNRIIRTKANNKGKHTRRGAALGSISNSGSP